ncbi:UDP-N-acetylenolpyruvoylglucosamine reductase [Alphaproteobacteria bacterium]|nr:UDP-N-acetylenolpyruvoylglucosamine reductase [Alphaproteobacteria bacterium]GHS98097.1 UDP-N-acetylenolpyruvoylglucosamine reductase [Alphaproteobacteria bacterium]
MKLEDIQRALGILTSFPNEFDWNVSLGARSSFKTGGAALCVFRPKTTESLVRLFQIQATKETPPTFPILGALSNTLIRDGGLKGITVQLVPPTREEILAKGGDKEEGVFPAGMRNADVCWIAEQKGATNLEFLIGIPGTLGGAVAKNAGAHGFEVSDFLKGIEFVDQKGNVKRLERKDLPMTYRNGGLPQGSVVTHVCFKLGQKSREEIQKRHQQFLKERKKKIKLEATVGTAGSAFKNPPDGPKAWQLIDEAGCRGLSLGDAQISEQHANFLLNKGNATASDLEDLGEQVRQRVFEKKGVWLEWEIDIVGERKGEA